MREKIKCFCQKRRSSLCY